MEIANQMILFAHVVEHGSFSASARAFGHTPSSVSKQISQLEDRLGVRLLNRTTRGIALTEHGEAFYQRCAEIAHAVAEAESLVVSLGARPQGTLRVAATVAFAKAHLLPLLPDFLADNDDLRLVLELTDRPIDIAEGEADVAIRFTEQITDPSVVARKLAANRRVICAAPSYLETHGVPEKPEDLLRHNCLRLSTVSRWNDWEFPGPKGPRILHVTGNFEANSADAVYHAVRAGLGVARLSTFLVGDDIRAGRLVRILPEYVQQNADILAVYASRRNLSPKVRVFVDFLADRLGPVPPWERE
jgi:DNA-binding transcriptional LysR family regulator